MRSVAAKLPEPPLLLTDDAPLSALRNVGKAMVADFAVLGISTVGELRHRDADDLYGELCRRTRHRHDPCVNDVFAAAVHQAKDRRSSGLVGLHPCPKAKAGAFGNDEGRPAGPLMSDIGGIFTPWDLASMAFVAGSPGLVIGAIAGALAAPTRRLTGAGLGALAGFAVCLGAVILWIVAIK